MERSIVLKHYFCKRCNTHYFIRKKPYTIHVLHGGDSWDIYYQKDGFPMMFAFGLPISEDLEIVFEIGKINLPNYAEVLFDE